MTLLRTRHSLEFNPVSSPLDPDLFPYADSYEDYRDKRQDLGRLVGTNDFIWCISASHNFRHYEIIKPVEWIIQVHDSRIRGYICDQSWFDYLEGRRPSLEGAYSTDNPPENEYSVLVDYPLQQDEIKAMRVFRFIDPDHADILCEKHS